MNAREMPVAQIYQDCVYWLSSMSLTDQPLYLWLICNCQFCKKMSVLSLLLLTPFEPKTLTVLDTLNCYQNTLPV